jgi:hypothetical protein
MKVRGKHARGRWSGEGLRPSRPATLRRVCHDARYVGEEEHTQQRIVAAVRYRRNTTGNAPNFEQALLVPAVIPAPHVRLRRQAATNSLDLRAQGNVDSTAEQTDWVLEAADLLAGVSAACLAGMVQTHRTSCIH